jgi:NAD+ diphosphatase
MILFRKELTRGPYLLFLSREVIMSGKAYIFAADGDSVLVGKEQERISIPLIDVKMLQALNPVYINQIGEFEGLPCYALDPGTDTAGIIPDAENHKIRQLFGAIPDDLFRLAGKAAHIVHWSRNNAFCGKCGSSMKDDEKERAKRCPSCGNLVFPRIAPAIITAVTRGNEILLAQGNRPGFCFHSVLAGFVEPGENLEECVAREIMEEVGISVKNIRYFASQEWPFPDSLMIAFTAEYAGGDIVIDPNEIVAASWFTKDNLPAIPGKLSVARKLIDWFIER